MRQAGVPKRTALRSRAFWRSTSRSLSGAVVVRCSSRCAVACATRFLGGWGGGGVPGRGRGRGPPRLDRLVERGLVGQAGLRAPADLADVLEGGGLHLLRRGGRLEVVELSDVAAHASTLGRHA